MLTFTAVARGVLVLTYALAALAIAWNAYVMLIGFSLFRYATKPQKADEHMNVAGVPEDIRQRDAFSAKQKTLLFSLPHESWTLDKDQLQLKGFYFPHTNKDTAFSGGTVILVHGWRDVHVSRASAAMAYLEAGFNVFIPILRGHAPSGGNRIDLGAKRRDDLYGWMDKIREEKGAPAFFVLDGLSMGAANVLTMSGDDSLPPDVKAIIADCGYSSLIEQGRWMIRGMKPVVRELSFAFTLAFFWLFMNYKRSDPTPLSQVKKASVPLLIIHGKDDKFVPTKMGEALYEACSSKQKELLLVDGAKHAMSEWILGDSYWDKKFAFIQKAL